MLLSRLGFPVESSCYVSYLPTLYVCGIYAETRILLLCELTVDDKRGILSFDVSSDGLTIAAGTELKGDEAHLIFWCAPILHFLRISLSLYTYTRCRDVRNSTAPTHISTSAHSDDITSLSYHPSTPHLLLSASTDGLLCTTDAREVDEDESTVDVGNWGCSVAKAGYVSLSLLHPY